MCVCVFECGLMGFFFWLNLTVMLDRYIIYLGFHGGLTISWGFRNSDSRRVKLLMGFILSDMKNDWEEISRIPDCDAYFEEIQSRKKLSSSLQKTLASAFSHIPVSSFPDVPGGKGLLLLLDSSLLFFFFL